MPRRPAAAPAAAPDNPPAVEHLLPSPAQPQPGPQRRWRKVLYERQPGGDAYTGEGFLEELVVNATVPHRDYATVAWSTLVVDQELSTVAAVGSASFHLYSVSSLICVPVEAMAVVAAACCWAVHRASCLHACRPAMRPAASLPGCCAGHYHCPPAASS